MNCCERRYRQSTVLQLMDSPRGRRQARQSDVVQLVDSYDERKLRQSDRRRLTDSHPCKRRCAAPVPTTLDSQPGSDSAESEVVLPAPTVRLSADSAGTDERPSPDSPSPATKAENRTVAMGPCQQAVAGRPRDDRTAGQLRQWWVPHRVHHRVSGDRRLTGCRPRATHRSSAVNRTTARVPHERQLATGAHGCNTPTFMRKTATQHGCPTASLRWGCRPERQRRSPRGRCRRPARTGEPLCAIVGGASGNHHQPGR